VNAVSSRRVRRVVTFLLAAIAFVVAAPILLTLVACRSMLYHPTNDEPVPPAGWTAERLRVEPEVELVGLVRSPTIAGARGVLFFGGNGSSIGGNRDLLRLIDGPGTGAGLAVFAYRGYDGSDGEPAEPALKSDARAIVRFLAESRGFEPAKLVLIGQSLGSGVASYLAAELSKEGTPPRALILLSPYTSIARVFDDHVPLIPIGWAVRDSWRTDKLTTEIKCPVLIIHGTLDTLITIKHGRRLTELFGARAKLLEIEAAGHNDLFRDPRTAEAIRARLED
jgi:uncharacterized protein